tara:strand:- start:199 stop:414 length:216 start_codon:yes stop_codon:yes gene_type:complete
MIKLVQFKNGEYKENIILRLSQVKKDFNLSEKQLIFIINHGYIRIGNHEILAEVIFKSLGHMIFPLKIVSI